MAGTDSLVNNAGEGAGDDAAALAALGYTSEYRREMSPWGNFALGFTYLSPVVGVYTLFGFALATGGPPMIWSLVIAGVGQLLVATVFGEVVSQFPVSGGIYPWARRLWGRRWAWMAGWVYALALLATIASVSYGAGPFVALMLGFEPSTTTTVLCALVVVLIATLLNLGGTRLLARAAIFGFAAELAGAVVVGVWLLTAHREHGLGAIFHTYGAGSGGSYAAAFLASSLIGVYLYYGFEACGDVAEEVADPGRRIPRAMRMTIYVGGAASVFVTLALILSVPDFAKVISGEDADPVYTVLQNAFGNVGTKIVLAVVLISFLSCALSLQAAGSRMLQSYGRDKMIFGSKYLAKLSAVRHVPPFALAVTAVVPALVILGSTLSASALTRIVSFAALGIYIGFQMIVLAALRARLKGWQPSGAFSLGKWGLPINIAALVYGALAAINMAWPRTPDAAWYDNYLVIISAVLVVVVGLVYLFVAKPHDRSEAPAGDAIPAGNN